MEYYTSNEHGRELLGLPPTKISYAAGTDYLTCAGMKRTSDAMKADGGAQEDE